MNIRPDPTFHASPKLAMEAPPESFAYAVLLSPDSSKPDALAVIDVKPGSSSYGQVVHTVGDTVKQVTSRAPPAVQPFTQPVGDVVDTVEQTCGGLPVCP